jgi:nitrogen fixation/metabolism regulation signal transduction histidine kinase
MKLFTRLALLMVLLVLLPAVPAAWMARELVTRSLNLGLSPEIDSALEAGVRQAGEEYQRQRRGLADSLDMWIIGSIGRDGATEDVTRAAAGPAGERLPGQESVLQSPGGAPRVLRGSIPNTTSMIADSRDAPPRTAEAARTLADGGVLTVRRPMSEAWRSDAQSMVTALQTVRGLQLEREALESAFWLPFLGLYGVSVLAAVLVAGGLARGLVVPVRRLVRATQQVGAGNWNVRVPVTGRDEISRLSEHFNDMIRRLDEQSQRLLDLEDLNKWKQTARMMAHEVRNPLAPIKTTVEELHRRYREGDREYAEVHDRGCLAVIEQVVKLEGVVKRFRDFSRPVDPVFAPLDLNSLVAAVAALLRDLRVELDLAPDLGTIRADGGELRQVLLNLVQNARVAMDGRENPRLLLATRAAGEVVVLEVEDNGPGIPEGDRSLVFEPFRSTTPGGMGLGLALVKGIVLAHRGSVRAGVGRLGGACLRVELPRDPEASHV